MKSYSQFLSEKIALWADMGVKSENWDRLLIAILPVLVRQLKSEQSKKKVEDKKQMDCIKNGKVQIMR